MLNRTISFLLMLGTLAFAGCVSTVGEDYNTDVFNEVNERAGG